MPKEKSKEKRLNVRLRVLLVDDNQDDLKVFGRFLELQGCEVNVCHDPSQCVPMVRSFEPQPAA